MHTCLSRLRRWNRALRFGKAIAFLMFGAVAAQPGERPTTGPMERRLPCRIRLVVPADPEAALQVTLQLPPDTPPRLRMYAAAGGVGDYAPVDFTPHFRELTATDAQGRSVPVNFGQEHAWEINGAAITISWKVDGRGGERAIPDGSVTTHRRNGYTLVSGYATFLMVEGLEQRAQVVTLIVPEGWKVAWALPRAPSGEWRADSAFELLDEPVMVGTRFQTREVNDPWLPSQVHLFSEGGVDSDVPLSTYASAQERALRAVAALGLPRLGRPYHVFVELRQPVPGLNLGWALEHGHSMLAEENVGDWASPAALMIYHLAHHMLHAWLPRQLYTDALQPLRQARGEPTGAIWFAEGFPQYLAFVGLARSEGVPTPVALDYLWKRFATNYSQAIPKTPRSMIARSRWLCTHDQDDWAYAFSEGALLAMWLDELLRKQAPERGGLPEVICTLHATWHDGAGIRRRRSETHSGKLPVWIFPRSSPDM
jgi:predicted metalloprotease with PDZ domain